MNKPLDPTELAATDPLRREIDDGVATLTMVAAASRNSLSDRMLERFTQELDALAEEKSVKAIVIAAEGPVFCAGHDLKEVTARRKDADGGRAFFEDLMVRCAAVMQAIVTHPKPVIAQVHAMATAAGCQLVASCDLAVAGTSAQFCTPGVNIGLFCSTPMVALSRNVSHKHAMEMLLTGDPVDAARAAEIGLVNRVVADGELARETHALAAKIASKSGHTLKVGKQAFYRQRELDLGEAYAYASQVMIENLLARDADEGIGAFLEKRPPEWHD